MAPDRSIGAVLSDIVGDLQHIIRAEVRLAKSEIREEVGKAKRGAIFIAAGGVVLTIAFGLMLLAAVYALATVWPPWMAALAVGGATALIGGLLAMSGKSQLGAVVLPPQKTVSTVKENLQWAKTRIK
jgi:uncharacterized membrane protein YqjE